MKILRRFPSLLQTSKNCFLNRVINLRQEFSSSVECRKRRINPKALTGIPECNELWREYVYIEREKSNALKLVLDELIGECNISNLSLSYSEKMNIMISSVDTLIEQNLVTNLGAVLEGLLSHLEPFPFNYNEIEMDNNALSVRQIRNVIVKQYLAWKFKTSAEDIDIILSRFKIPMFMLQSMRNLRRNCDVIEGLPAIYNLNVSEKIYHINQIPFNMSLILNFQDALVGVDWSLFSQYCPKILHHSYQYILFLISSLKKMQFTNKQIQEGLPFLHLNFFTVLNRLNNMLTHPEIVKYRNEDKFLHLISYNAVLLNHAFDMKKDSFSELINLSLIKNQKSRMYCTRKSVLYLISKFYEIDSSCSSSFKRHKNWKFVSEEEILDTLTFLKSNDFKGSEVAESITIIFYPRDLVKRTLEKIKAEETALKIHGFKEGQVHESTNFFTAGTKSNNKILQLCLYYLEKSFNVHESGAVDCTARNEVLDDPVKSELMCL